MLHRKGLRFRVHQRVVPGATRREVDIVFTRARVAVSVLGCFWHGCPDHTRLGKEETRAWWQQKLKVNAARDADTRQRLTAAGWEVVEVWECDDLGDATRRIAELVAARR